MMTTEPDKKITYAISHDETGGCLFLLGKLDAPNIVLTCAGFPDDHSSFTPLARRLAEHSNCLVGVICLPGYDDRPEKPWKTHPADGFTFTEWTVSLREAAKVLKSQSTHPKATFTGIFHDWGVVAGLMFTNRALKEEAAVAAASGDKVKKQQEQYYAPDRLVLFDVCLSPHPKTPNVPIPPKKTLLSKFYNAAALTGYRVVLGSSFLTRRYVSAALAKLFLGVGFATLSLLGLNPLCNFDLELLKKERKDTDRLIYMSYPYFTPLQFLWNGRILQEFSGACLPKDLVVTPVLYLYGIDKNVHFHDNASVCLLQQEHAQRRNSHAIPVQEAGHWLYRQQEDFCFTQVDKFIHESN
jgi:pimeloyl-ACP methyl ester carboxylesterase